MKMAIVTATTQPFESAKYWESWRPEDSDTKIPLVMIINGVGDKFNAHEDNFVAQLGHNTEIRENDVVQVCDNYLGTVPAFAEGFQVAKDAGAELICCFHDDVQIHDPRWALMVHDLFETHPDCWLAGFGGAMGVGQQGMYDKAFDPMTLARHSFGSNLVEAETHGARWLEPRRVAVLDGFSLICRVGKDNPFRELADMGIVHHAYDVAMGCFVQAAKRETWYLPIDCHHAGGRTAVLDTGYLEWAKTKHPDGDQGLWLDAHRLVYNAFHDVLPFHVEE